MACYFFANLLSSTSRVRNCQVHESKHAHSSWMRSFLALHNLNCNCNGHSRPCSVATSKISFRQIFPECQAGNAHAGVWSGVAVGPSTAVCITVACVRPCTIHFQHYFGLTHTHIHTYTSVQHANKSYRFSVFISGTGSITCFFCVSCI